MKAMLGVFAVLAAVVASSATADNTDRSANYYLRGCRDFANRQFANNPFLQGECVGLLEGLSLTASIWTPSSVFSRSCTPDDVTLFQIAAVVVTLFGQHPEHWHQDFRALVLVALHDAWPCK